MTEYVITPQDGSKVIYGVMRCADPHLAFIRVLDAVTGDHRQALEIFFYDALASASGRDTTVEDSEQLVDGGWFEMAPTEPLPGGQPGGDHQIGDAWSRRFALKRQDGFWAVATFSFYLALPPEADEGSDERIIERYDEYVVCENLHEVSSTERAYGSRYTALPYEANGETLLREAAALGLQDITWDGEGNPDMLAIPAVAQ